MIRSMFARASLVLGLLSLVAAPAAAQTNSSITVIDGAKNPQTLGTGTAGGKQFYGFYGADAAGGVYPVASAATQALMRGDTQTMAATVAPAGSPAGTAQTVQANALPLPTGAASSAKQDIANAAAGAPGDAPATTTDTTPTSAIAQLKQAVVKLNAMLTALGAPALPAGAATSAKQDAGNTTLATLAQNCAVLAAGADAAYTAGDLAQRCTMTTTGRVRVGLSSAAVTGAAAAGSSDLQGAVDDSGNQQPHRVNGNGDLKVANRASVFFTGATGSSSALAASATFTGATRDSGVVAGTFHQFAYFTAYFLADQAGTAAIDCSNDGTTFFVCSTVALTANAPVFMSVPVLARYHRARVVNGSTAEGSLFVNSGYTGA